MKVAVINFSGNTGKSTIAKHLLLPRMKGAALITVESINADEGDGENVRGKHFGALQEQLMVMDSAVIDVGSSNVEDFMKCMQQYRGSHEEIDVFVVPAVKDGKQIQDTIATIQTLAAMDVPAQKIRVVFNRLESDETIREEFYPLFAYHEDARAFTLRPQATIQFSEIYQRLRHLGTTIDALLADQTDDKAALRQAQTHDEKRRLVARISAKRLAASAQENLDAVFAVIMQ